MAKRISTNGYSFILGDCLQALRLLPENSIDAVVTSPPYNLGITYSTYNDRRNDEDYLDWSVSWAMELSRVLKDDGSLFINIGASPSQPTLPHKLVVRFEEIFRLQNTFHWIKSISIERPEQETLSVGHFKPINSYRYVNDCHEYIFHFTKEGKTPIDRLALGVPYQDKSNIARWAHTDGQDKRCRGNNWFVPYKTIRNRKNERPHPATFPTQLAENCLRIHGAVEHSIVLDPFVGIGHTAQASLNLGIRNFAGIDLDEDYLKLSIERTLPNKQIDEVFVGKIKGSSCIGKRSCLPTETF
ncbi:MAG: site-specific DNA-methyltransferase [Verrucomicrobiota bacterium]